MSATVKDLDAVILAGGRATRMGGQNKALISYKGQPLFRYALANVSEFATRVIISTNRDHQYFGEQGFETVDDGRYQEHGPLAGIAAAFEMSDADGLIVASCDQLALPPNIYPRLIEQFRKNGGSRGTVAKNGMDLLPTCAVLPKSAHSYLIECLENNQLRLIQFIEHCCEVCEFSTFNFANINSLDQIE